MTLEGREMYSKNQSSVNQEVDSKYAVEPSGPQGDNPSTASSGPTKVKSSTPENRLGHINPSAPENTNTTPGTTGEK